MILGAVWGVWHLPGFFVRSELGAFSPAIFIFTMLSCILSRLLWTWVTNHSRGSGIIGVLLHASSNAASLALIPAVLPAPTPQQMAASGMLLLGIQSLAALLIMLLTGGRLSFHPQRMETGTLPEKMLAESQMG